MEKKRVAEPLMMSTTEHSRKVKIISLFLEECVCLVAGWLNWPHLAQSESCGVHWLIRAPQVRPATSTDTDDKPHFQHHCCLCPWWSPQQSHIMWHCSKEICSSSDAIFKNECVKVVNSDDIHNMYIIYIYIYIYGEHRFHHSLHRGWK